MATTDKLADSPTNKTEPSAKKPPQPSNRDVWSLLSLLSFNVFGVSFLIGAWHLMTPTSWGWLGERGLTIVVIVLFLSLSLSVLGMALREHFKNK